MPIYISTRKKGQNLHLQLLLVFYNLQKNHPKYTSGNMGSFQCFSYTKPYFPLLKHWVHKLWIFLRDFPQFSEIRDSWSQLNNFKFIIYWHLRQFSIYTSTTFPLGQCTIYRSVLINFDLKIYNLLTKLNVDSTAQTYINLQSTFAVAPTLKSKLRYSPGRTQSCLSGNDCDI